MLVSSSLQISFHLVFSISFWSDFFCFTFPKSCFRFALVYLCLASTQFIFWLIMLSFHQYSIVFLLPLDGMILYDFSIASRQCYGLICSASSWIIHFLSFPLSSTGTTSKSRNVHAFIHLSDSISLPCDSAFSTKCRCIVVLCKRF